ncbi:MAG: hypothetical protein EBZ77_07390 [Chitinophagia bacterium]|nr:hypothetical protein [Chitinophagia bacterium]
MHKAFVMKFAKYWLPLLLLCTKSVGQVVFSSMPLDGVSGSSFYIVNHVDHDTSATALRDYNCGSKTYDGHQGTDFVLRSFKTMDSGVNVKAVAAGRVVFVSDTQYDRNKHVNSLGFGNYIAINHQNTIWTYYAHIRKHSAVVHVGDSVVAGQVLAKVGCSGNCTDPHVHLEVYDYYSNLVDPFTGTCQTAAGLWASQPTYDTTLLLIDKGCTPYVPNLDTLRERYLIRDTFYLGVDTTVNFWVEAQGIHTGDTARFEWYSPLGSLWFSYYNISSRDWWYYYDWSYINTPDTTGWWTAKYYVRNRPVATQRFYVLGASLVNSISAIGTQPLLFPNPTTGEVHLRSNGLPVAVTDLSGRLLLSLPAGDDHFSLAGFQPGLYLVKCGPWVEKLLKE